MLDMKNYLFPIAAAKLHFFLEKKNTPSVFFLFFYEFIKYYALL